MPPDQPALRSHEEVIADFKSRSPVEQAAWVREVRTRIAASHPDEPDFVEKWEEADKAVTLGPGLGMRWHPLCPLYTIVNVGWLDVIFYDFNVPFGPMARRIYNFQVCLAGDSPEKAFNYFDEKVKVEYVDLRFQERLPVSGSDNPDAYAGFGGDLFDISYHCVFVPKAPVRKWG